MGRNSDRWTEGRFKSFIVSILRAGTRRWAPKYEALEAARTTIKKNVKTKRLAQHYQCASCAEEFPASGVQVDHIIPVISPERGFTSWDDFIERLYCEKENLQVLCKPCHDIKTKKERDASKQRTTT